MTCRVQYILDTKLGISDLLEASDLNVAHFESGCVEKCQALLVEVVPLGHLEIDNQRMVVLSLQVNLECQP